MDLDAAHIRHGCSRHVEYEVREKCAACDATGAAVPGDIIACIACSGQGHVQQRVTPFMVVQRPCPSCAGAGTCFRSARRCGTCHGERTVFRKKSLNVKIPAGMPDGHVVQVEGKGPYDATRGVTHPLAIKLRHVVDPSTYPSTDRAGNVEAVVGLELAEALCGFSKTVRLLGDEYTLASNGPKYTDPASTVLVVPGGGLPAVAFGGGIEGGEGEGASSAAPAPAVGDLRIRFKVSFPLPGSEAAAQIDKYHDVVAKILKHQQ